MRSTHGAVGAKTVMLGHWLAMVPGHLLLVARLGRWTAAHDELDGRLGKYGMGRN